MSIGNNIRKRRIELHLTQQELADILSYKSKSTIAKIENGTISVSLSKLESFANALHTTIDFLMNGKDPENKQDITVLPNEGDAGGNEMDNPSSVLAKVVCVVLAGGKSTRNNQNTPNQFVTVNGIPIISYVMKAFQEHPAIDSIYVVTLEGWERIVEAYARSNGITKLAGIIPGKQTGALSVVAAIEWLWSKLALEDIVIFQESTRPLVSSEIISSTIRNTEIFGSSVTYEPMDDYLQFIQTGSNDIRYIDRSKMISVQSPEGYRFGKLKQMLIDARKKGHPFDETCCAMLMYNLGHSLTFCEGNRYNLKIVRQEDIRLFEALLEDKNDR